MYPLLSINVRRHTILAGHVVCFLLACGSLLWAQAPPPHLADFTVDYTGALFGYYRMEPDESINTPRLSVVKHFSSHRHSVDKADSYQDNLLLGMGDNFAPEFGASVQLFTRDKESGLCVRNLLRQNTDLPGAWYKESGNAAIAATCDNVTTFLQASGYRAVVPGREDLLYSADWLKQVALFMRQMSRTQDDKHKLHMLASNLRLKAGLDDAGPCPLLFSDGGSGSAMPEPRKCVLSGGQLLTVEQDWILRLDSALVPQNSQESPQYLLSQDISNAAASNEAIRRQLLINQTAQFFAMEPPLNNPQLLRQRPDTFYRVANGNVVLSSDDFAASLSAFDSQCNRRILPSSRERDLCVFGHGMFGLIERLRSGGEQRTGSFLLENGVRAAGRDALLRIVADEQRDIGYTFSERTLSGGSKELTLLVGVVGENTMKAVSPTNLTMNGSSGDVLKVTPVNALNSVMFALRAAQLDAVERFPGLPISHTIIMAQMPHTEAEELAAHLHSELNKALYENRISVDLILSEAQADHATPCTQSTFEEATLIPVLTPHPAFQRNPDNLEKEGLVNPFSSTHLYRGGIRNDTSNEVIAQSKTTTLQLLLKQKIPISRRCTEFSIPSVYCKVDAEQFLLRKLLNIPRGADVVMLERRDMYFGGLPEEYSGYSTDWCANTKCQLWVALDRILWKGDSLERVMVSGKNIKDVLNAATGQTATHESLEARDTTDQWLLSFGITTYMPDQLTLQHLRADQFGFPIDSGCKGDPNAPKPDKIPYCINGSAISDEAAYSILTSDHVANDNVVYSALSTLLSHYHEKSNDFITKKLMYILLSGRLQPEKEPPSASMPTVAERTQLSYQHRDLFHWDYSKAVAGLNLRRPQGGNAAAANFQGVTETRASQPTQQEVDLESLSRFSWDLSVLHPFSAGVQTDAEYDRATLGNLTGKPINASYALNSLNVGGFLQKRIPFFRDAKTTEEHWGSRELPRTLVVLTPHQYQQQINGNFLSVAFSSGNGEDTFHLPRVTGFVDKIGIRHEGPGVLPRVDRASYLESGFQLGIQNNVLQSVTLFSGSASQTCSADTKLTITQCASSNKQFTVDSSTSIIDPATGRSTLQTETLHASGIYWDVHLQRGWQRGKQAGAFGIIGSLDTKGDFFFARSVGKSLSTQTRYAFPITGAVSFPIARNLSLAPTFTSFLYESQLTRQSIVVNTFLITARWYYDRDSSVGLIRQLFFKGPATLDQTKTSKIK